MTSLKFSLFTGRIVSDKELLSFGASWCVGKKSDCEKKIKPIGKQTIASSSYHHHPMRRNVCKFGGSGSRYSILERCENKLSFNKYYKACKMDMLTCPNNKCYCESLLAYTRECERLGVQLDNWQKQTGCDTSNFRKHKPKKSSHIRRNQSKSNTQKNLWRRLPTSSFNNLMNFTRNTSNLQFKHPPPPIPIA